MEGGVRLRLLTDQVWFDAATQALREKRRQLTVTLTVPILIMFVAVILACESEASGEVLDNFEWKVPGMSHVTGYDQRSEAVLTDPVTGEVYVVFIDKQIRTQGWTVNSLVCARIDPATGHLIDCWAFEYKGNERTYMSLEDRAFLIHDGHFYFLFYSEEGGKVHLRMDNGTKDVLSWTLPPFGNNVPHYRIIGIDRDRLYFMVREEKDGETWFYQYTVFLDDFDWTKFTVMVCPFELARVEYLFRDGRIYFLMERNIATYTCDFVLDRIDTRTGERMFLRELAIDKIFWDSDFRFDVDSDGNLHVLLEDQERILYKVAPTGELLSSIDLNSLWGTGNESYRIRHSEILVNRTDHIYVIGRSYPNHYDNGALVSFVLSSDYSGEILRHVINASDPNFFFHGNFAGMNGTGEIFVAWYTLIDDLVRVLFSYQIPLTPDLSPIATCFRVLEVPGEPEPVTLRIRIDNVGRAISNSHWVEVAYSLNGSEPFDILVDLEMDLHLRPGDSYDFVRSMALPQGSHLLRVRVHDVSPYENNVLNNVFQTWFYVANNNPPTIGVVSPEEGQAFSEEIMVSGTSEDLEPEGELTTYITGLPSMSLTIQGRGPWNRTIDLDDVLSGEYILGFRAYDGQDYSRPVYRRVRVSRDVDQLRLDSFYPSGDVTLIEGDEETFFFNVTDPLARSLDNRWRIGSETWANGGGSYHFIADRTGDFSLSVEVTNGLTTLSHTWNITVLPLIPPRIDEHFPTSLSLSMKKRESISFSVRVINHHDLPYSLIWTLDGEVLPEDGNISSPLSFDTSGEHQVSVLLIAADITDSVTWDITVTNSAPTLDSWKPSDPVLVIEEEANVTFEVLAIDDDSDMLDYLWTIDGRRLPESTSGIVIIRLPCDNDTHYEVRAEVSDGEVTESLVWTIQPQPPVTPTVTPEDTLSWRTVGVSVAIFLAVVGAMAFAIYHVRRQQRQGPDS